MESGLIPRLASRLGIAEPDVLRKAEEYLRLSQVKCAGLSAHTTETSNAVMCLDLAASCMKCPLDRVSGRLRTSDPAQHQGLIAHVSFFSSNLKQKLLYWFSKESFIKFFCRILKLKVDKNKMVATSGVKKAIFDRLCKQLEKLGQQLNRESQDSAAPPRKRKKAGTEPLAKEREKVVEIPHKPQKDEDLTQDYEEWKRKILENAAKAQAATAE
ncbi:origin recognition complex subunit 6-like [Pteropus vampyrus]|uniref:Origin recognition complex subunit 6-like n=1 Tax=Pteropus vampyrus TaxID=132908 RepID=A0A6P6C530_PTEVA|nr:origin recognition complex subunit 6-like [Pteropus vampyrus]